jgi:hypothetical protein
MLMQHSVQVDNSHAVTTVENHNQVATQEDQSWQSEYPELGSQWSCDFSYLAVFMCLFCFNQYIWTKIKEQAGF